MANINELYPEAFSDLCESIKRGDYEAELSTSNKVYYLVNRKSGNRLWAGCIPSLKVVKQDYMVYYFSFLQKIILDWLIKDIIAEGEKQLRDRNRVEFKL